MDKAQLTVRIDRQANVAKLPQKFKILSYLSPYRYFCIPAMRNILPFQAIKGSYWETRCKDHVLIWLNQSRTKVETGLCLSKLAHAYLVFYVVILQDVPIVSP